MTYRMTHLFGTVAMATGLLFGTLSTAQAADDTIEFGWTAWSDAEFVTKLAKQVIEDRTDYNVKLTTAAIGVQYQAVANGDLDGMLMAWLPKTHASYWKRFKDDVVDLGPLYEGAQLGWVVPDYIPEDKLSSIKDLKNKAVREKLDGEVQGIDPGAGLMQASNKAMEDYGLSDNGYRLVSASGAAMTAALAKAEKDKEWIVVTGWTPHWMFGRWDLRFLDDPKESLGGSEHIDAVVRQGFKEDYPKVARFLSNMHLPLEELQAAMNDAQNTSYEQAIDKFVENHPDEINDWFDES